MPRDKKNKSEDRVTADPDKSCEEENAEGSNLKPARPKIGEDRSNLKQREEWFQKRSGKK